MRELPKVRYEWKTWYFDARLSQLSNVRNPHDYYDLNDLEAHYFKERIKKRDVKE